MKRTIFTIITTACLGFSAMAQEQAPASTTTSTTASTTVGSIPGTSGVSPTGAATYTIPIAVPTGINGMQPQISINYNSQGGYGALGRGWDVAAGSAITRVPRNEFYDGVNDRIVSYSNTDGLMLDGQRLILLSGVNLKPYATYGFENENYTRVKLIPGVDYVTGNEDDFYFEVTTKEGNVATYGNNTNVATTGNNSNAQTSFKYGTSFRNISQTHTATWRLSETSNINGQTMQFSYIDNGVYLSTVKYKGGVISFFYQTNPCTPPASPVNPNVNGRIAMNKLLQSVTVAYSADGINPGPTQRTYSFNYATYTDKLSSIDLSAADGTKMNSTSVNWNPPSTLTSTKVCPITNTNLSNEGPKTASVQYADVNGDGWADRIQFWCGNGTQKGSIQVYLYDTSTKTFSPTEIKYDPGIITPDDRAMPSITCGDLNNDGVQEIILNYYLIDDRSNQYDEEMYLVGYIDVIHLKHTNGIFSLNREASVKIRNEWGLKTPYNSMYTVDYPKKKGTEKKIHQIVVSDQNNDGYNDIIYFNCDRDQPYANIFLGGPDYIKEDVNRCIYDTRLNTNRFSDQIYIGDFHGDGKIDASYMSYLRDDNKDDGNSISIENTIINFFDEACFDTHKKNDFIFPMDYNSDGITEYLVHTNTGNSSGHYFVNMNSCPYLNSRTTSSNNSFAYDDHQIYPIDVDGDGQTDIITGQNNAPNQKWTIFKNNNGTFNQSGSVDLPGELKSLHPSISDFNGDGVADLMVPTNSGFYAITTPNAKQQYLVQSITNGMGLTTAYTYKNFTNYEDGQLTGDILNVKAPILMVDKVTEQNGSITEYDFQKPKVHIKGKGFLGFTEMTVKNKLANRKTVSTNSFDTYTYFIEYNQLGKTYKLPKYNLFQSQVSQSVTTYDDKPISTSTQTFEAESLKDKPIRFFLKATTQTTTDALSSLTTTVQNTVFDTYGNITESVSTTGNRVTTATYIYKARKILTHAIKYLPESITTTTVEGGLSYVRKKTFEYDTEEKGQVIKETTDPGDTNQLETTYSNLDAWGMPQTITVKGKENKVDVSRSSHKRRTTSGRFIQSETNAIGQYTTYNWDETTGLLLDKTEYLDKKTTYGYDSWGRLESSTNNKTGVKVTSIQTKEAKPSSYSTDALYNKDLIEGTIPYYSVVTTTTDQNSKTVSAPVTVWYDIYGREMKRMTYGLDATSPIYQFTEYTADGKLYRTSAPTYSTKAESWDKTYTYDDYGRVSTIVTPAGTETHYYSSEDNLKISSVIGLDKMVTMTEINDAGQTINVERHYAWGGTPRKKVTYTYYPSGLVHTTTPDGGATVTMEYDLQGRRTKLTDPDAGETITEYSAFGDVTSESRKKGTKTITTRYYYLANGLLDKKQINNDLMQEYKYYYDGNIKGRLKIINKCAQHNRHFYYDDANKNYDRVVKIDETVGVKTYTTSYTHDSYGRQLTETFPTGYATTNHYNDYGMLFKITDNKSRTVWEATAENVRGQLKSVNKNGITQTFDYDAAGRTTSINAYKSTPNPGYSPTIDWLVKMQYGYTTDGNLDFRKEFRDGNSQEYQRENFGYDEFNRLTSWAITKDNASTPALTHSIIYDPTTGNITNKSDVGSINMQYTNAAKPHQLTGMDGVPEAIKKALPLDTILYTDFDKVKKLEKRQAKGDASDQYKTYDITYGVDDQRITSTYSINFATQVRTTYLGDFEEEYDAVKKTYKKTHYLHGAILIQNYAADGTTLTSEKFYSTISDFQGSLIALIDEQGAVAERYAFDPWGARRNPDDWTQTDARTTWITHRGYTGHEHIDVFGVINMNGRVYDPMTAAFFSPDPFVQSAGDWMNYNRYTYCLNNPFRYTDPSGYMNFGVFYISGNIGYSGRGGYSVGISAGIGLEGVASVGVSVNYNIKYESWSFTGNVGAFGFYGYGGYDTQGGWIAGAGFNALNLVKWASPVSFSTNLAGIGYSYSEHGGESMSWMGYTESLENGRYAKSGFDPSIGVGVSKSWILGAYKKPSDSYTLAKIGDYSDDKYTPIFRYKYYGAKVYSSPQYDNNQGITLGENIIIGEDAWNNPDKHWVLQHEYGHYLRYVELVQTWGKTFGTTLYYLSEGLQSVIATQMYPKLDDYNRTEVEIGANIRSYQFHWKLSGYNINNFNWNYDENPLYKNDKTVLTK
jgi:RHS repeat-associated protein